MKDLLCEIVHQIPLSDGYFRIGLKTGYAGFVPGQFGMLEVPPREGTLLRRPFSFAKQDGEVTEILYKVVGKGTASLSLAKVGQSLQLLGPLGKGFSISKGEKEVVAVAGGYGIAPFLQLAAMLRKEGKILKIFYGARSKKDLHYLQEFKKMETPLFLATEDGSEGFRGLITELLEKELSKKKPERVLSCGPLGLLRAVKKWSQEKKIPCELSWEESMGCGTGVCLGCVVEDVEGNYLRACVEGPVFAAEKLKF